MADNMMNRDHKATNQTYRDNYDAIFGTEEVMLVGEVYLMIDDEDCTGECEVCEFADMCVDLNEADEE